MHLGSKVSHGGPVVNSAPSELWAASSKPPGQTLSSGGSIRFFVVPRHK